MYQMPDISIIPALTIAAVSCEQCPVKYVFDIIVGQGTDADGAVVKKSTRYLTFPRIVG